MLLRLAGLHIAREVEKTLVRTGPFCRMPPYEFGVCWVAGRLREHDMGREDMAREGGDVLTEDTWAAVDGCTHFV